MRRREVVLAGLSLPLTALAGDLKTVSAAPASNGGFNDDTVAAQAKALAASAYRPPDRRLPAALEKLGYDAYRDFRYRPARALWRGQGLPFQAQFFHRGFLFKERVDIHVVNGGKVTPFAFSTDLFDYAPRPALRDADVGDLGFAGFRLHAPLNRPDYFDEVCSFLGASYFRAVAKGLTYGLSARGLALGTGEQPGPEEFPVFKAFWLEQPAAGAAALGLSSNACTTIASAPAAGCSSQNALNTGNSSGPGCSPVPSANPRAERP